jgi:thiamine biosynthesis protein ThiS
MMIKVGGKEYPWQKGMTVADLLKDLNDPYPYAVVRINGSVISRPHFEKTSVPDGAEIFLIPMIAGG